MTLDEYMRKKKLANSVPAGVLKVTPEIIGLWRQFKRVPRATHMVAIYIWSKGAVEPNSFYKLPPLHDSHNVHSNQLSLLDAVAAESGRAYA